MLIDTLKEPLAKELREAESIWVATAMISKSGWEFLQKYIPKKATQNYLIGIDLATDPYVFKSIAANKEIKARFYIASYFFHPKVYITRKKDGSLTAFIGSANTTSGGLKNNVEMNIFINDQSECKNILAWFNKLFPNGYQITDEFIQDYKENFKNTFRQRKKIENTFLKIKQEIQTEGKQFFNKRQHEIFRKEYHKSKSEYLREVRRSVRESFLILHQEIYPEFRQYGLVDLHKHNNYNNIVSRHYFNRFSGNIVNAMWLHYGKSKIQLQKGKTKNEKSFINNIRMQVIIREDDIGIWLVLGKDGGSLIDREYFKKQIKNPSIQEKFFNNFKALGADYWIRIQKEISVDQIKTQSELVQLINQDKPENYFIIGKTIQRLDTKLSKDSIATTVLEEFSKLYPLYEIMRHK